MRCKQSLLGISRLTRHLLKCGKLLAMQWEAMVKLVAKQLSKGLPPFFSDLGREP